MRVGVILVIATFLVAGIMALGELKPGQFQVGSFSANGFDAILLDTPSWVTSIQRSWGTDEFFVFGRETLRAIHSGHNATSDFYAEIIPWGTYTLRFTDLHTFYYTDSTNTTFMVTFGLAPFDVNNATLYNFPTGSYIPLVALKNQVGAPINANTYVQHPVVSIDATTNIDLSGYVLSALRVDEYSMRSSGQAVAYFAGFHVSSDPADPAGTAFVLVRTFFNLAAPSWGPFTLQPEDDIISIYNDSFTSFSSTYKPWIHLVMTPNSPTTLVVIVDPNTKTIYGVNNNTKQITFWNTPYPEARYEFVSAAYDIFRQVLVVGVSAEGFEHGRVWLFDFSATNGTYIPEPFVINLPANYSNPKALTIDFDPYNQTDDHIYIGFNGWNEVLRYNYDTNQFDGYQRLPEYLLRSWDATVTRGHVYFVSNEQNSKVYRVSKSDFCPVICPFFGFCKEGKCGCADGFELSKDKTQCEFIPAKDEIRYVHKYHTAHGGEVALGVLFTLSFIAAAAGWFMWWRGGRRGAYQAV